MSRRADKLNYGGEIIAYMMYNLKQFYIANVQLKRILVLYYGLMQFYSIYFVSYLEVHEIISEFRDK